VPKEKNIAKPHFCVALFFLALASVFSFATQQRGSNQFTLWMYVRSKGVEIDTPISERDPPPLWIVNYGYLHVRRPERGGGGGGGGVESPPRANGGGQAAPGRMCLFLIYPAAVEVQKHVPLATTSVKSRTARSMHGGSLDQTRFVSMLAWQLPWVKY
jgi:hypothetical protein